MTLLCQTAMVNVKHLGPYFRHGKVGVVIRQASKGLAESVTKTFSSRHLGPGMPNPGQFQASNGARTGLIWAC